jgi:hypothetical protein
MIIIELLMNKVFILIKKKIFFPLYYIIDLKKLLQIFLFFFTYFKK